MNDLLQRYCMDVEFPEVSGAEHLQLLGTRDLLADKEGQLSSVEQAELHAADRRLARHAAAFHAELSRFTGQAQHRRAHQIAPARWWWYLDVLIEVPAPTLESELPAT